MNCADSSENFVISALIIGAIIGASIDFGTAAYIDYQDDGEIFNGSVKWYDYLKTIGLFGATYMFTKGGLPNNKQQNKQWTIRY